MAYYFSKCVRSSFSKTCRKLIAELEKEGFDIISEINVQENFKKKLNLPFRKYQLFEVSNTKWSYDALQLEENIAVMLPFNFVVQEKDDNKVYISTINLIMVLRNINNKKLQSLAIEVSEAMLRVLSSFD